MPSDLTLLLVFERRQHDTYRECLDGRHFWACTLCPEGENHVITEKDDDTFERVAGQMRYHLEALHG